MRIGIDLDNTIINYSFAFNKAANLLGFLPNGFSSNKNSIKRHVKEHYGNSAWVDVQASVYGELIDNAALYPGVGRFLAIAKAEDAQIFICSHKTAQPVIGKNLDRDFRQSALDFLRKSQILECGLGLVQSNDIFFSDTIDDKVQKISQLKLDVFIDDLPVILKHKCFPLEIQKFLFLNDHNSTNSSELKGFKNWNEIQDSIFGPQYSDKAAVFIASLLNGVESYDPERLNSGANSSVFRLQAKGSSVVLKIYRGDDHPSVRSARDAQFSRWLNDLKIQNENICLIENNLLGASIFKNIEGKPIKDISDNQVIEAAKFIGKINRVAIQDRLIELPDAKEACFRPSDIFRDIDDRLSKLQLSNSRVSNYLQKWVMPGLAKERGHLMDKKFTVGRVVASPSDFGFHNAIQANDGKVVWFDFEYAGLDGIVKLGCDFMLHPGHDLNLNQCNLWIITLCEELSIDYSSYVSDVNEQAILFAKRWVCIILWGLCNRFLNLGCLVDLDLEVEVAIFRCDGVMARAKEFIEQN